MITGSSIGTLIIFIVSIIFVIHPAAINIPLKFRGRGKLSLPINLTTAPILAIAVLWAAQCLGPKEIRDGIVGTDNVKPYNILILFFSLAYLAITLDITGVLEAAAYWVSNKGGRNGYKLFFYFYVMLTTLSVVLGNDPVILSGTAFLVYYTKIRSKNATLDPIPWLISEFAAANTASMVLFVGNPTNVVICEGFSVNNAAFTAYTVLPFIGCSVACFITLAFQFRSPRHVPKKLEEIDDLSVRSALVDPIGALVGSFLFGSCLIVLIVVSFFHVDVWKITLPFAAAKFLYDISMDLWKTDDRQRRFSQAREDISGTPEVIESKHPQKEMAEKDIRPSFLPISGRLSEHRRGTNDTEASDDSQKTLVQRSVQLCETRFPMLYKAVPRLPFALVPFAFSQFILIEALARQGWIDVFSVWLQKASGGKAFPTIWLVGVLGVVLCNISGTNIGATILLTKVVKGAHFDRPTDRAAAIALAVASNIGAVSFTFSASLAGLLWKQILNQKDIYVKQREFARWNFLPLVAMTGVGLAIVCAEIEVLYHI